MHKNASFGDFTAFLYDYTPPIRHFTPPILQCSNTTSSFAIENASQYELVFKGDFPAKTLRFLSCDYPMLALQMLAEKQDAACVFGLPSFSTAVRSATAAQLHQKL